LIREKPSVGNAKNGSFTSHFRRNGVSLIETGSRRQQ
jgi:hypothetical protein